MFSTQVIAYLPEITFEQPVYTPLDLVGHHSPDGWESFYGQSSITPAGQGYGGTGQALKIAASPLEEAWLRKSVDWNDADTIAFIDFRIKPAATPSGGQANFLANGTQLAFQIPPGSTSGELWVLHGNDGAAGNPPPAEQWYRTAGTFSVPSGTISSTWLRATLRHDYGRNLWDLFIDGKLAAVNLGFEGRGARLDTLEFFGSKEGDTLIDNVRVDASNMLFVDTDKDGLPDAWETANGSNPNLYDRDLIDPTSGKTFLNKYLDSLWNAQTPGLPVNGSAGTGNIGTVPPLTLLGSHRPVGSLKGKLDVGADGSANYSIPIDIPKGTAGMEPKISLNYSSNGGNGVAGLGWSISGVQQIVRGGSSFYKDGVVDGIDFDDMDRFFLDGERLICVDGTYGAPGSRYRTEMDSFARITAEGSQGTGTVPGPASWKIETKSGLTVYLGETAESKIEKTEGVLSWAATRLVDSVGNYYRIEHAHDIAGPTAPFPGQVGNQRVIAIRYTGHGTSPATFAGIFFDYEARQDRRVSFTAGVRQLFDQRLAKIRVETGSHQNHRYELRYDVSQQTGRSLLKEVVKIAAGREIPATKFEWKTLGMGQDKWLEATDRAKIAEYGADFDSRDGVNGMISPVKGNSSEVHLTGSAWRAIPLKAAYPVTANTILDFEYSASPLPTFAMIGLDEDLLTTGSGRLIKLVGGNSPPGGVISTSLYQYETTGAYERKQIAVGGLAGYPGSKGYLVLVNDDVQISGGVGESRFRNIKIYESGTDPATVAALDFGTDYNLKNTVPQMVTNQGSDLGLRINDYTGDGRADFVYRNFYNKTAGSGDGINLEIYGQTMVNVRNGYEIFPFTTASNLISGIKGNATDAPWARRVDLPSIPVDINGDGKTDFCFARNVYRPGTSSFGHNHGFLNWTPDGWEDRADWALPFSSQNNVNYHRFNHFQFTDLNADGLPDVVVHMNTGSLMNDQNGADGNAGSVITTTGAAWLNRIGSGGTWEQSTSYVLPKPLKIVGVANGELGRRIFDANADGLPDFVQSRPGDGRETYLNTGSGFSTQLAPAKYNLPVYLTNANGDDVGARLVDLNGDGLTDVIKDMAFGGQDYATSVHLNTGDGWQKVADGGGSNAINPDAWNLPDLTFSTFDKYEEDHPGQSSMVDVNGDGLMDIVVARFLPGDQNFRNFVYINTGMDWWRSDTSTFWADGSSGGNLNKFAVPQGHPIYRTPEASTSGKAVGTFTDINGDGAADYISDMDKATPKVWINQCGPELIQAVTDGFGARLEVDYTPLNDPNFLTESDKPAYTPHNGALPAGQVGVIHGGRVVTRLKESDGLGGYRATRRHYGDYRFDRVNQASLGFGWVEVYDEHFLYNGGYVNLGFTRTETCRSYPFAGSPALVQSFVNVPAPAQGQSDPLPHQTNVTPGLKMVSKEVNEYALLSNGIAPVALNAGGTIKRTVQTSSIVSKWDLTRKVNLAREVVANGVLLSEVTTLQPAGEFDDYGFVKESTVKSLDGVTTVATNTYTPVGSNDAHWHLGRLTKSQVKKRATPNGPLISQKTSEFVYHPDTGLLTSEIIERGHPLSITRAYEHDDFGNVAKTMITANATDTGSPQTRVSKTVWTSDGRFPEDEYTGFGTEYETKVHHHYDEQCALLTATTDIDQKVTSFYYDVFGTLVATGLPDGTAAAEITRYASNNQLPSGIRSALDDHHVVVKWARSAQASGSPWSTVYYDVLGREVAKETLMMTGAAPLKFSSQYQVTLYDARGRKYKTSNPFFEGNTIHWTITDFDVLNRQLATTHPDGTSEGIVSIAAVSDATNPLVHSVLRNRKHTAQEPHLLERWEDQHGRLVQSKDESDQITTFTHDVEGHVTQIKMDTVVQLTNSYDPLFGHKTGVDDASGGISSCGYNGFGEMVWSKNPNSEALPSAPKATITTYDIVGRVSSVTKPEGTYTTTYRQTSPAKGSPSAINGPNGYQETFTYGSATHDYGRITGTTKRQSTGQSVFSSSTAYNALGEVMSETDAGGLTVVHEYDPVFGSFRLRTRLAGPRPATLSEFVSLAAVNLDPDSDGFAAAPVLRSSERLAHNIVRETDVDIRTGRVLRIFTSGIGRTLQNHRYRWDKNGNLEARKDGLTGKIETFGYDTLDRLTSSKIGTNSPVAYGYDAKGNLISKGGSGSYTYSGYRVTSAPIKGQTRSFTYNTSGQVVADGKRTFSWTSFNQLKEVYQVSTPALETLAMTNTLAPEVPGIPSWAVYLPSQGRATFEFDATGARSLQSLVRTFGNGGEQRCLTRYLGVYEIEEHETKTSPTSSVQRDKTLYRHHFGDTVYTDEAVGSGLPGGATSKICLAVVLKDHIGSTDVTVRADWDATNSVWKAAPTQTRGERQSYDAWGERRNASDLSLTRTTHSASQATSAMDHDRGFTGHEMLDDFGLVHMNGRIYDPELGRFLGPDPYVQIPHYSQNYNRYSYVLNNPLSFTDPTGHEVSGIWTAVVLVVVAVVTWGVGSYFVAAGNLALGAAGGGGVVTAGTSLTAFTTATVTAAGTTTASLSAFGMATVGAIAGAVGGGLNSAIAGGDLGDVLRGAAVGAIQGAISGGVLHGLGDGIGYDNLFLHVAGHGVVGGAANEAMGGRFQDGFLSAAAGALGSYGSFGNGNIVTSTIKSSVVGGTAAAIGGGKFANGAMTAGFQHLLNMSIKELSELKEKPGNKWAPERMNEMAEYFSKMSQKERGQWIDNLKRTMFSELEHVGDNVLAAARRGEIPMAEWERYAANIYQQYEAAMAADIGHNIDKYSAPEITVTATAGWANPNGTAGQKGISLGNYGSTKFTGVGYSTPGPFFSLSFSAGNPSSPGTSATSVSGGYVLGAGRESGVWSFSFTTPGASVMQNIYHK